MSNFPIIFMLVGVPFLFGLAIGRGGLLENPGCLTFAVLGLLPAAYLLIQSGLHGDSCPGGECIGEAFVLIPALGLAGGCLGFLAGALLARFTRSSPEASARADRVRTTLRWLVAVIVIVMIARIGIIYWQAAEMKSASSHFRPSTP